MKGIITVIVSHCNLPHKLAHVFVKGKPKQHHKMVAGVCVMCVGVCIAHLTSHIEYYHIDMAGDLVGYGIHGIGATPFIEYVTKIMEGGG